MPKGVTPAARAERGPLAIKILDRTDYVFISWTGPRKMSAPSAKLTGEAEIAVIRTKGGKIEQVRDERITRQPAMGR